jgi:hypothetical protein
MQAFKILWLPLLFLAQTPAFAHGENKVLLQLVGISDEAGREISQPSEGEPALLTLRLVNEATGRALTPSELEVVHERQFHLFAFDAGLTNYLHEHPESQGDSWVVKLTFRRAGQYKLWSDITLKNKGEEGNVHSALALNVNGPTSPNPVPPSLAPKKSGSDGISVLSLEGVDNLRAGKMAMPIIRFSRTDGTPPVITPFLGAMAHMVITSLDGHQLIHAHPMDHNGSFMLHTVFPRAGDYRIFGQFVDGGVLRTVELAVRVR